ncbi:MAG: DUF3047 domain-containing protein [Deltaproteobacteria bacterium]
MKVKPDRAGLNVFGPFLSAVLTILFVLPSFTARTCLATEKDGAIWINIEKNPIDGAPKGWILKQWKGLANFSVEDAPWGKAIRLKSHSTSSALYRDVTIDIKQHPYLNWRWKAIKLPENGDVRKKSTDDQAVQLYIVFPRFPPAFNNRIIGYIWDTNAPAGSMVTSTKTSTTRYVVVRTGGSGLGHWFNERRNVYDDYKTLFKEDPPQVGSVSVMIDSDDTKSSAESLISDIYFSKGMTSAK